MQGLRPVPPAPMSVEHYENFPVASWLCPPAMRPAVRAIYGFARTADDLADEGDAPASARADALARYRRELDLALAGQPDAAGTWPGVFVPLAAQAKARALPPALLHALLDAFEEDVWHTGYDSRVGVLAYCRRSANPVGRLLLHLQGIDHPARLAQSDDICTALQLINFWQDLSVDRPRGRWYVPADDARRHGLHPLERSAEPLPAGPAAALARDLCAWARDHMLAGAPLARAVPGRLGWELRFVVQGGLCVLDQVDSLAEHAFTTRPTVRRADLPRIAWRALWHRPAPVRTAPTPDTAPR